MSMRLLITGFEPFDKEPLNPTEVVVRQLETTPPEGYELRTAVLPVDTTAAPRQLEELLDTWQPDVVLLMGVARRRPALSLERVAINVLDFNIPDNAGQRITDLPVIPGGPAAYFSTLPVRRLLDALRSAGIPAEISYTAGTYLCNQVFYAALHWAAHNRPTARIGFVHVPALPEQAAAKGRPIPSMALATILQGLEIVLKLLKEVPPTLKEHEDEAK